MPIYAIERHEVVVGARGRRGRRLQDERLDTFTTDDIDMFRRELLDSHLGPSTA